MKFRVTMKDSDGVYASISQALKINEDNDPEDQEEGMTREDLSEVASQWIRWGEYLTVEIDTEARACVVIPSRGDR